MIHRRTFLKAGVAAGAGLVLPFCSIDSSGSFGRSTNPLEPGGWIAIGPDGTVTITIGQSEMGQGVRTALPMIAAEELDVEWSDVLVAQGGADPALANPILGRQRTAWSSSVRGWWKPLRETAARARAMLILAAADEWQVGADECQTRTGVVRHVPTGREKRYGDLAAKAALLDPPSRVSLKPAGSFRLIGKSLPSPDAAAMVSGSARYGIDSRAPGMLVAVVARCPLVGGRLRRYDPAAALEVRGVKRVEAVSSGVAVLAEGTWPAIQGRRRLAVEWEAPPEPLTDSVITRRLEDAMATGGALVERRGRARRSLDRASRKLRAEYRTSLLAHAPMEPMNCLAHVRPDWCDVWVPTQDQAGALEAARRVTGLPAGSIRIHTTLLGGGFGRRVEQDFVVEAVELSRSVGAPVQVVWTREDDLQHDFYHPPTLHGLEAAFDGNGRLTAWAHTLAGGQGRPTAPPYSIPDVEIRHAPAEPGVRIGIWRSVDYFHNVFASESFVDEAAHAAGIDPVAWRLGLLDPESRLARVLEAAAERAGWGRPLPRGQGRGVAIHEAYGSSIAMVSEVEAPEGSPIRVVRVVCAADCGVVVHPGQVRAQIEGAVAFGLTAALYGRISLDGGAVQERNFDGYRLLAFPEMPPVEVELVLSGEPPGGVGELGVPPVAPSLASAVFAARQERLRRLPMV